MYEWSTVDPRHPHNRHTREDVGRHEDEDSAVVISDDADAKDSSNRYSLRLAGRGPRGPSPQSSPSSVQSDEDNQPEDVATSNANQSGHNKNSRYLREMDRRAILARLANGEKQATLAKEYQVSRAAICNLNKHRDEVMSRTDENPLAKHPKKRKARMLAASKDDESAEAHSTDPATGSSLTLNGGPTSGIVTVHEVKSRAVQLLLTTLRHPSTSLQEFRRCSERMIRLVMEEALAVVPAKPVEVFLNDVVKVDGVGISHPPCAISLEPQYCPMMDMFHLIEPEQPTGYARIDNAASPTSPVSDTSSEASSVPGTPSANVSVGLLDAHLPTTLAFHNVFLLDVVAASGEVICATLQQLKTRGAVESMLHVVALFVSSEVVAMVQCKFPGVKIITAQIDSSINKKTQRGSNVDGILLRLEQVYNAQHLRV
ncbi:hypothetical protein Poli38472_010810 [Pythium oligandrum]|uniref:Phosphoribosyltransferase domain-containing protein n=1 Tax=Pythium oligandrum TaxID=41045 RepID=A0A8K1CEC8_PYTOL|nr:hypothetical protein Poli38472_010810 [Pythium oligandrum]|eukprot:TMW61747.1 hypothetical protein Poli38472_010810 [Pythium oligandrum]